MPDSDIITRCPQCNTAFRVTSNQLSIADGVVRCGSCLAVFKAYDYELDKPAKPEKKKTADNKPADEAAAATAIKPKPEEAPTNNLIQDQADDNELEIDDDVYDLDSSTKSKKTSLFDRKIKPITQQTRESADESWALDMLMDLEDDDEIEPLQIKKKPKEDNPSEQPKTPPPSPKVVEDSFEKDNILDEVDDIIQPVTDILEPIDESKEVSELEPSLDLGEEELKHTNISDEAIENAMHTRTSYVGDPSDYLSRIEPAPVEMEWYESQSTQRWFWIIGCALLSALLITQIAVFRFDELSKHKSYRPIYATICKITGCQLPNLIDLQKIRATNLIVRSHPNQAEALVVDAILINSASFEQPYPTLKLEFTDLQNRLIASSNLKPRDYLRGELAGASSMPSNQPIQLSLAIVDPGENAVNYQLSVVGQRN